MKALTILPTLNERDNLARMVESISLVAVSPQVRRLGIEEIKVLVVDDDSPDGTGAIADELAARTDFRVAVLHRHERGRATAGIAGFKYALANTDAEYILEMDCDFSHNPDDIPRLLEAAKTYDVVVGSRFIHEGKARRRMILRAGISRGASVLARVVLGMKIRDPHGGFRCYRRAALAALDWNSIRSKGYAIEMELLYRLQNLGCSCTEVPIVFEERRAGKSKFSLRFALEYVAVAIRLRLGQPRRRRA